MATSTAVATKARNAASQRGKARAQISQMQVYTWVGIDKRGTKIKGEQISKNASLVKADLRKQGINPQVVKAKPKPLFGSAGSSIKGRDIAVFSRQLATMMAAGVPMVQGFEIVAGGQSNPRMKDMLTNIKTDIEGGSALNEALGKYPVQFDELFTNLVKAGESAGVLDTVGSHTLANACAATRFHGAVAACGLAQGGDFPATVMPFILRGVTLYGINSVFIDNAQRAQAWALLAEHLDPKLLEAMTTEIGLSEVIDYAPRFLDGKVRGRTIVDVRR